MISQQRRNVYDNIRVSVRGLTAIIFLGIFIMGALIFYGYLQGNAF